MTDFSAYQIVVTGRVQGVGYRPFVSRLAHELNLVGWVRNRSGQVEIWVEGSIAQLDAFKEALVLRAPPLAQPDEPSISCQAVQGMTIFTIQDSKIGGIADAHIPPDYFVCNECLDEMQNPTERRYRYPFINCTQCGPRYTLIERLPYDRQSTAMAGFELCFECRSEYTNPLDRRYHAEPLACSVCGPELTFYRPVGASVIGNEQALSACIAALREGLIIAVKGIGGYHLFCDANNLAAVSRLRERKQRPQKPLAILVPWRGDQGMDMVYRLAVPDDVEQALLCSPQRPIVLLQKSPQPSLCENIAPNLGEVGVMLPYSPLHHLLANEYDAPLVATSANLSGEPVLTDSHEVERRLNHVADAFLHHNRPILRPADDSVARRIAGKMRMIRVGRGLAPIESKLSFQFKQPTLAIGADLKNTVGLGFQDRIVISPHIGDLGALRSHQVFEQVITDLIRLYEVTPELIVCDAHPDYFSRHWALKQKLPVVQVYHHHAHASALFGEHHLHEPILVYTWDGTGYGEDGSIWGGEALLGMPGNWRRVSSLRPFNLPGGDKASREPWRSALSLCLEQGLQWPDAPREAEWLKMAWEKRINCVETSSAGRLFDAAAALIGLTQYSSYEGHAAMQLEAISYAGAEAITLPLLKTDTGLLLSDWTPLLVMLMDNQLTQGERGSIFHATLAGAVVAQARAIRDNHSIERVGLSGGVFQNRLLTEQLENLLRQAGFEVYLHEAIPAGDGGISFGQLIEAAYRQ